VAIDWAILRKWEEMTLGIHNGRKNAEPILLDSDQITAIKDQPDTPKGRRDKLLICLALDHGLRVSELAILQRSDFYFEAGTLTFDRPKTGQSVTLKLSDETVEAARKYFGGDNPGFGSVWQPSLSGQSVSTGSISKRIRALGKRIAINNLSPDDLRHTWATNAAKITPLDQLIYAGGWTSVSSALPYIKNAKIAIWK
jgi:integrase